MMMKTTTTLLVFLTYVATTFGQFNPIPFTLPSPPMLVGSLEPNYALYNAEKMHYGKVLGPTSYAFLNGDVFTVTADRKVFNIATCQPMKIADLTPPGCNSIPTCGMLISIRADNTGHLLVLDAYRGLFRVHPTTGAVSQLYTSRNAVNGRTPKFLNGLVQLPDGTIIMSDSSENFDAENDIYIILEGRPSGRLLALNPNTLQVSEILRGVFTYPNGLELTADGSQLLVAEMGRAQILSVGITASNLLQVTPFSQNLPGLPGNIRRSSRGTFWVGLSLIRHAGIPNSMDTYSRDPQRRFQTAQSDSKETIRSYYPQYGMVVELDPQGRIIGSLHDPTGRVYSSVSEAAEIDGLLYIATPANPFPGRIVLPQGDGRVLTVDSVIQVLRSRCQIPEDKLVQAKAVLTEYLRRQTQGQLPATTPPSTGVVVTSGATTGATTGTATGGATTGTSTGTAGTTTSGAASVSTSGGAGWPTIGSTGR